MSPSRLRQSIPGIIALALFSLLLSVVGRTKPATAPQATGTIGVIQHVVFLIKENRTFDHLYGTFPGANGATSGTISTGPDTTKVVPLGQTPDVMPDDIPHTWSDALLAMDSGEMDKFNLLTTETAPDGSNLSMTQYHQSDIPNYWSYAQTFTLGDNMFSALHGPSFPNHLYTVGAQSGNAINNPAQTPLGVRRPKHQYCRSDRSHHAEKKLCLPLF